MAPKQIEHYRLEEKLGAGGMGEVYRAWDEDLERPVAIKLVRQDRLESRSEQKRLRREALTVARLVHPAIVHIHHKLRWEGHEAIVMELVEGETLAQQLRGGPLAPHQALPLLKEIAEGLAYAHDEGFLHRDLKTANVMVTRTGHAKILDFGLARELCGDLTTLTEAGTVLGTLHSMSPEQAQSQELDFRSDLFSLGVLCYETLTGISPFRAESPRETLVKVLHHHPAPVRDLAPQVPAELSELIGRLLEKEPERRPESAAEVVDLLGRLLGTGTVPARPAAEGGLRRVLRRFEPRQDRTPTGIPTVRMRPGARPRARRRLLATAFAAVAVVLAVAYGLWDAGPKGVVVLGFAGPGWRDDLAWLSTALPRGVDLALDGDERLRLPSARRYGQIYYALRSALEPEGTGPPVLSSEELGLLRRYVAADYVVLGVWDVTGRTGELRLRLFLQDTTTGGVEDVGEVVGTLDDYRGLVLAAGKVLRKRLEAGELTEAARRGIRAALPEVPAARPYFEGLAAWQARDLRTARDRFQEALERAPGHPLVLAALGDAHDALGYRPDAEAAYEEAASNTADLPLRQRLLLKALHHMSRGELEEEIGVYDEFSESFPDDLTYGIQRTDALLFLGEYQTAAAGVEALRQRSATDVEEGWIDLLEAEARLVLGEVEVARRHAASAVTKGQRARAALLEARAHLVQAAVLTQSRGYDEALWSLDRARELFERLDERVWLMSAFDRTIEILYRQGKRGEAREKSEKCLAIYRRKGDRLREAQVGVNVAIVWLAHGMKEEALALFETSLSNLENLGSRGDVVLALLNLGTAHQEMGALAEARESYGKARKIFEELSQRDGIAVVLTNLGEVSFWNGEITAAREHYEAALSIYEELGMQGGFAYDLFRLGEVLAVEDRLQDAEVHFNQAMQLQETEPSDLAVTRLAFARLELLRNNFSDARKLAKQAEARFKEEDAKDNLVLARIVQAQVLLAEPGANPEELRDLHDQAGLYADESQDFRVGYEFALLDARLAARDDPAAAREKLEQVVAEATGRGFVPYVFEARLALGEVEMAAGRTAEARDLLTKLAADARARGWASVARRAETLQRPL